MKAYKPAGSAGRSNAKRRPNVLVGNRLLLYFAGILRSKTPVSLDAQAVEPVDGVLSEGPLVFVADGAPYRASGRLRDLIKARADWSTPRGNGPRSAGVLSRSSRAVEQVAEHRAVVGA